MEREINEVRAKRNVTLYKKYKIFAYDFLFYYAVEVLFFTTVKGFSMSELMYISAIYTFSAFFWQLFGSLIVEKLGLKKSIILGNFLVSINCFLYIVSSSFWMYNFANFFLALGFSLKGLSESSLLYSSLKKIGRREEFTKIEGKSNSKFYYLDGFSSILSGFLFIINGYLPFICCFICTLASLVMSFKFKDFKKEDEEEEQIGIIETFKGIKEVVSNKRSKSILLLAFVFWGIVSTINMLYKAIIIDIGIIEQYSTLVVCLVTIFVGFGSRCVYGIEKVTKNKTLTIFSYSLIVCSIIIGIIGIYSKLNMVSVSILLMALAIIGVIQGAYRIAMKKYVLSFTTSKIRIKMTSAYYIVENLGKTLILFISGLILEFTTNSIACLLFSIISLVLLINILKFMKGKLGLRPEQYSPEDINYTEI